MPKITSGLAGWRHPSPSMNQAKMAKTMKSSPAMKREKESVQSFLLMGSQAVQIRPAASRRLPVTNSQTMRSASSRRRRRIWPASTPNKAVAMAGSVLTTPSGSQVLVWA